MPTTDIPITDALPWLKKPWDRLLADTGRIPHALLIASIPGLGKNYLANAFARWLLCAEPEDDRACGHCKNCRLFSAHTHPDLRLVAPEEEGKAISIDAIRELNQFLSLTPHTARRKVVILSPAETMTLAAANSLLKQLEEPAGDTVLLLVSHQTQRLPITVRSRCSRVAIPLPTRSMALNWLSARGVDANAGKVVLAAAAGAPLAAEALAQQGFTDIRGQYLSDVKELSGEGDPLSCAKRWQKNGSEVVLSWFHGYLLDVLKTSFDSVDSESLSNPDAYKQILLAAKQSTPRGIAELLDCVIRARQLLTTPVDERLLMEDILIRWNKEMIQKNVRLHGWSGR